MRNFFIFLRRFSNQLLFLVLVVICFILMARTRTLQGDVVLNSANALSGSVYSKQQQVVAYFRLREMNDSLLQENRRLQQLLVQPQSFDTLKEFTVQETTSIPTTDTNKEVVKYASYTYRSARVINNSTAAANNYLTINRGTKQGVRPNMAVVSGTGIVGKVIRSSANYAVVLTVLSEIQPVSARLKDGTAGLVVWEGKRPDLLMMGNIPAEIKVKVGDTVTTTNYSFFPAGMAIARVQDVMISKKTGMKVLYLKPFSNFRKLQYVYVIENKFQEERKQLEDSVMAAP